MYNGIKKRIQVMKKTYITPAQVEMDLYVEQMLAASGPNVSLDDSKTIEAGSSYSAQRGWGSDNMWSSLDEE